MGRGRGRVANGSSNGRRSEKEKIVVRQGGKPFRREVTVVIMLYCGPPVDRSADTVSSTTFYECTTIRREI